MTKNPTYEEASAELDEILSDIETGDADIDVLSEKVERAAKLIQLCREKLQATEMKVTKIVEELASDAEEED
ncbi:MAG: exodeoxyribonuclease VII small subunit [Planctomycetota bacterium]|nr:exodeoxyribonuclease VII small subunit [Planctomycetota bacterium]